MKKSIIILLLIISYNLSAQEHHLKMIGRYDKGSITLRWAPEDAVAWKLGNQNGYTINKYPVDKKTGKIIESKVVRNLPVKVWPIEKWRPYLDTDKYMTVACGIIYDSIRYTSVESSASFLVKDLDLKNRMGFALLAADFSQQAAIASALGYHDNNIDTSYHYLYELMISKTPAGINADTAYLEMVCNKIDLLAPAIDRITMSDSSTQVWWERPLNKHLYTAYYVERSLAAENKWIKLNAQPFIYADRNDENDGNFNIFEDLKVVDKSKYAYRIIGLTPFGDFSAPSDTFQITFNKKVELPSPEDVSLTWLADKQLKLEWKSDDKLKKVKGFYVARSIDQHADFEVLNKDLITGKLEYIDPDVPLFNEYYYKIYAVDQKGNYAESHTVYTHRDDKTPPSQPYGLQGAIGKDGMVKLSWKAGTDEDLMGYKVFYANDSSHIFTLSQNELVRDTIYTKIIKLNNLSPKMYFKIQAIDMRHNGSELSRIIELSKPDSIPPMAAEFVNIMIKDSIATINWLTSKSSDVGSYHLLRKKEGEEFKEIWSGKDSKINKTVDKKLDWNTSYTYQLITEDESGNKSYSTVNSTIKTLPEKKTTERISALKGKYEKSNKLVKLEWKNPAIPIKEIMIYKYGERGKMLKKIKLEQSESWSDLNVSAGKYKYAITYISYNGIQSEFAVLEILCD